jgi:CheY-like chemotaxis protein
MKIFVVDDDPIFRMLIVDALKDPRDSVREFDDGKSVVASKHEAPDLVLLDIEMPGMDGITACKILKAENKEYPQIIFVSGHDDLESRLAAYAVGARDFVVKPFDPEEVTAKVEVVRAYLERFEASKNNFQYAQQAAFTAMSSLGELGVVLQFLRNSFSCRDRDTLGAAIMDAVAQYGLDGMVELRSRAVTKAYSCSGGCSPLQRSILTHVQTMDRIFRFRSQLVINYPNVTLVILNLPADEDLVGRLRDHLALLTEGADTRLQALEIEQMKAVQDVGISQVIAELTQTMFEIEQSQAASRVRAMEVDSKYLLELVDVFVNLGLTDSQENILANMAQQTRIELAKLREIDGTSSDRLREIRTQLNRLIA